MNIQAKPDTYITKRGTPAKRITFQRTEEKIAIAARMWQEGFTGPTIAERMGVSKGSVTSVASQHRDRFPSRLRKGKKSEDGRHVDIPADWLKRASALWLRGNNANKLAEITGVKGSTAYTRIAARPDLFPEHRMPDTGHSVRKETQLGDDIVIHHAKRMHLSGEVHTLPRVSTLNGKEV
ncbi:hypothetical protein [Shinella sp.]|uniref:hypothetical protein n=1 Tax=Shinella sp. TaxID=1870904 RepID=UPI00403541C0